MLAVERRNTILTRLQLVGNVVVAELGEEFGVTEETIRRDLEKLEAEGLAKKTYGGAVAVKKNSLDLPFNVRKSVCTEEKQYIAELVSREIKDGDTLMLDASSTAGFIVKRIKDRKNLTVITNSVEILIELSDVEGWTVISSGGTLREGSLSLVGGAAIKTISSFHADIAIISAKGIDTEFGVSEPNEQVAEIKRAMLENSTTRILAVDSSKFDKMSLVRICRLQDANVLVTDKEPDEKWISRLSTDNVRIVF